MAEQSIGKAFVEIDLDPSRFTRGQQKLYKDATQTTLNIERNFKNLGIKSAAEFDLMRQKIANAYNMIAHSSKSTANDIVRAEIAKNEQLKQINEQQFGHQKSLLASLKSHWIAASASIYAALKLERMAEGWIRLYGAQEQAERGLKQVMVSMKRYSGDFYESLTKQASAMQKLTGIGDEAIIGGQKFLMTFKQIPDDMMPRTTRAMLDLAALMGGDTTRAALTLGKAAMGMTGELRRVGITVDTHTFKLKGYSGVLAEIEDQVKGQAEALGKGYGKWKILGAGIGDAKENLGEILNKMIEGAGIIDALTISVNALNTGFEKLSNLDSQRAGLTPSQRAFDIVARNVATQRGDAALQSLLTNLVMSPEQMAHVMEFQQKMQQQAKSLTSEYQKARGEVLDLIDKMTTSEYDQKLQALNDKFEDFRKILGDSPDVIRAYSLALNELNQKFGQLNKEDVNPLPFLQAKGLGYGSLEQAEQQFTEFTGRISEDWRQFAEGMHDSFVSNFEAALWDGENLFEGFIKDFGRMYTREMAKVFSKQYMQPIYDKMAQGISDSITKAMSKKMSQEEIAYGDIGLGVSGYTGADVGLKSLAIIGAYAKFIDYFDMWKPIFQADASEMGGMQDKLFDIFGIGGGDKSVKEIETSVSLMFDTIDGVITLMSDEWENLARDDRLIESIREFYQNQYDFYNQLNLMLGGINYSLGSLTTSGLSAEDIERKVSTQPIQYAMENVGQLIGVFGEGIVSDLKTAFEATFSSQAVEQWIKSQGKLWPEFFGGPSESSGAYYFEWFRNQTDVVGDFEKILAGEKSYVDFLKQQFTIYEGDGYKPSIPYTLTMQDIIQNSTKVSTLNWDETGRIIESIDEVFGGTEAFKDFLEPLKNQVDNFNAYFAEGLGDAFVKALETGSFGNFTTGLRQQIGLNVKKAFLEGIVPSMADKMLGPLFESFGLGGIVTRSIEGMVSGDTTAPSINDAVISLKESFDSLDFTQIQPLFNTLAEGILKLNDSFGLNTEALGQNTDAILGPVESFLRDLTVGPYAPALSLEGMQAEYAKLYQSAYFDPEAFGEFASYGKQYLDFMRGYGGYETAHAGVVSDTMGIPWVQDAFARQKEEQQALSVNSNIQLTSHIDTHIHIDSHQIANVVYEVIQTDEDVRNAIGTIVQNEMGPG